MFSLDNKKRLLPVVGVLAPVHLLKAMLVSVELSLDQVQVPSVVLSRAPSHTEGGRAILSFGYIDTFPYLTLRWSAS